MPSLPALHYLGVLLAVALLAAAPLASARCSHKHAAKNLVVFGDSLSDSQGNYFKFISDGTFPDPKWYPRGNFAGGEMWPDYVASWMGLKQKNYAYARATACASPDGVANEKGLLSAPDGFDQVEAYLAKTKRKHVRRNFHVLFLGSNDYRASFARIATKVNDPKNPPSTPQQVVGCLEAIAKKLLHKGAKKLLISDLPPISVTPGVATFPTALKEAIKITVDAHNSLVQDLIANLTEAHPHAKIALLPTGTASSELYNNYDRHSLVNNHQTALITEAPTKEHPAGKITGHRPHSKRFYWFDDAHPTSRVHKQLAKVFIPVFAKMV